MKGTPVTVAECILHASVVRNSVMRLKYITVVYLRSERDKQLLGTCSG